MLVELFWVEVVAHRAREAKLPLAVENEILVIHHLLLQLQEFLGVMLQARGLLPVVLRCSGAWKGVACVLLRGAFVSLKLTN